VKKTKLTKQDHKRLARILLVIKRIEVSWAHEIFNAVPVNSRLFKKITLFNDLLTPISSEMEALYYRDTTPEERSFPDDLIHWGDPDIVEDLKRLNLI
jgi:hypothetical protein